MQFKRNIGQRILVQRHLRLVAASLSIILLSLTVGLQQQTLEVGAQTLQTPLRSPDVPYVPTPQSVVDEMLRMAKVTQNDVIYDLGSGDGRIVITAAQKYGARGVGIDINPVRIAEARQNALKAGVSDRVEFRQQDLFETNDLNKATVVTLYLLPSINVKLRPKLLRELRPGTRIVSHAFDMGKWFPEHKEEVAGRMIYYWTVPENPTANLLR